MMTTLTLLKTAVISGHAEKNSAYPPGMTGQDGVKELIEKALAEEVAVNKILKEGLIGGMEIVGKRFSAGEYFVPDMLLSAQAMKAGMQLLVPLLVGEKRISLGTVVLGTVQGDMHDIGKNLVRMMLEGAGFEVIDLGVDTPPEKFLQLVSEHPEAVVGMSALLTTTMNKMQNTLELLRKNGLKNKVILGGAAVSQKFADEIGADGFTRDAAQAVPLVKKLLEIPL